MGRKLILQIPITDACGGRNLRWFAHSNWLKFGNTHIECNVRWVNSWGYAIVTLFDIEK